VLRVLLRERLLLKVAEGRAYILVTPDAVARDVFLSNYWAIVAIVLEAYAPAAVIGVDAVHLHLDEHRIPAALRAYHAANGSIRKVKLWGEFTLRLRPAQMTGRTISAHPVGGVTVPVLSPVDTLLSLDATELAQGQDTVTAWMRHLTIPTPAFRAATQTHGRSLVMRRLADLAATLGNRPLARDLDGMAEQISEKIQSPERTETRPGERFAISPVVLSPRAQPAAPWMDLQALRLERAVDELRRTLSLAPPQGRLVGLLADARAAKAMDTYHNTTMEGYRISEAAFAAIVAGQPLTGAPRTGEELEAAMAVQGYSQAFDQVLELAARPTPLSGALILDLYETLFRPSVDAGIVPTGGLRGWRNGPVSLRGFRYIPPNHVKLPDLMNGLEQWLAASNAPTPTQAAAYHLEFVTIHPFMDGNGRLGRLLMNLMRLWGGLPWVTIPSTQRVPFFQALEIAQVDDDPSHYARFMRASFRDADHRYAEAHPRPAKRAAPAKKRG
jgi:Fic family protein